MFKIRFHNYCDIKSLNHYNFTFSIIPTMIINGQKYGSNYVHTTITFCWLFLVLDLDCILYKFPEDEPVENPDMLEEE